MLISIAAESARPHARCRVAFSERLVTAHNRKERSRGSSPEDVGQVATGVHQRRITSDTRSQNIRGLPVARHTADIQELTAFDDRTFDATDIAWSLAREAPQRALYGWEGAQAISGPGGCRI